MTARAPRGAHVRGMHMLALLLLLATSPTPQQPPPAHPCRSAPEYRQFDFWIGEWDVEVNGKVTARSSIQSILDGCVIFENFEAQGGYSGKSLSAWDAGEKRWEQHYADTNGGSRYWVGKMEGERMVMFTEFERNGTKVTQRMTYSRESGDRVRQLIEVSLDGGKTWKSGFDGMYIRRKG